MDASPETGTGAGVVRRSSAAFLLAAVCFLLPAAIAAQQPSTHSAEQLREWITDARAAFAAAPQQGDERVARLAELQARARDLAGARETARGLAHSWVPWGRIAIAQRDSGDLAGAIESANMATSDQDRSQALGYLASALSYDNNFDPALSITRTIVWPKQRIEGFKLIAMQLRRTDTARARALLREAVATAAADTSHWGRYFEVDLAYEQAAANDLEGALRILTVPAEPVARVERLTRMATAIRQSPIPRGHELADSLFRVALASVDSITDSTRWSGVREAVVGAAGPWFDSLPGVPLGGAERRRQDSARARAAHVAGNGTLTELPDAVNRLTGPGDDRRAAEAIVASLSYNISAVQRQEYIPPHLVSQVDSLARSAVRLAGRESAALADNTRLALVHVLVRARLSMAKELAQAIGDGDMRSQALVTIAGRMLSGLMRLLPGSMDSALAYAASADPSPARDEFYASATSLLAVDHPAQARATADLIAAPSRRAIAQMLLVYALAPGDTVAARATYAQALPLVDPLGAGFRAGILRGPYLAGDSALLRSWARSQPTAERRAVAFRAIIEMVGQRPLPFY